MMRGRLDPGIRCWSHPHGPGAGTLGHMLSVRPRLNPMSEIERIQLIANVLVRPIPLKNSLESERLVAML